MGEVLGILWGRLRMDYKKPKEPVLRATFDEPFRQGLMGLRQFQGHPGLRSYGLTTGGPQYRGYRRRRASMG